MLAPLVPVRQWWPVGFARETIILLVMQTLDSKMRFVWRKRPWGHLWTDVESATRAMTELTSSRLDTLVHELALTRLLDGQFDECDLTMRDLERIERSLAKTLQGIYHGRIAYPSTKSLTKSPDDSEPPAAKSA